MFLKTAALSLISLSLLTAIPAAGADPQARPELHPLYDKTLADVDRLLMEVRLDAADSLIGIYIERHPEHPAGYFFRAASLSWRIFLRPRDTDLGPLRNEFERSIKDCRRVAERASKRRESEFEGLLYLGAIYGQEALLALIDHKYLVMAPLAKQAWNYIGQTLVMDPRYYDSYFGKGMYQYFIAILPKPIQLLAEVYGFESDREQGLANIRLAAERGLYSQEAAGVMLMNIYSIIEQPDDYVEDLARKLYARFPDNPLVHWRYGDILLRRLKYDQAAPLFEAVAKRIGANAPYYRNQLFSEFSMAYRLGVCYRMSGNSDQALARFDYVIAGRDVFPDWVVPGSWLAKGEILIGRRDYGRARQCLQQVLELDDYQDFHERAEKLLEEIGQQK